MVIRKTCPSPELTLREAAYNMALLTEHERDAGKNIKRDLYFGVYCSRSFIVITRSTSLLERIKRYIQWLFGSISYKQDAIDNLAARSRRYFVPANEMKAKIEQVEAALLKKDRLKEERHQNVEQELRNQRQANVNWRNACQQSQGARAIYEQLHREMQNREAAKDQAVIQKQQRINTLELDVDRLQTENQRADRTWRQRWKEAEEAGKFAMMQARQEMQATFRKEIQAKDKTIQGKDRTIQSLKDEITQLRQAQQPPVAAAKTAGPNPQPTPAVAAIPGSPQIAPAHQ
ncbi:MAG: hypothetical protein LLG04_02340 [Parachlamydia sp.]|nr:hypothetical protein [Parachlamydia sp.]